MGHTWLVKACTQALCPWQGPLWKSLPELLEDDDEIIKPASIGLKVVVKVGEFGGGIGVYLFHTSGKTFEPRGEGSSIRWL